MDVIDAGVYVQKWEATVPKAAKLVLWGPLQAKELGLEGWEVQDGGETGFIIHNPGVRLTMGRATSTLIFVRRMERAFLTVYLGGYPTDAPSAQRRLDAHKAVAACEIFLTRLAKEPIQFSLQGEITLVDNANDAAIPAGSARTSRTAALTAGRLDKGQEEAAEPALDMVSGAPSWARVPKGTAAPKRPSGKIIDAEADVTPRRTARKGEKGGSEVWEV